jgi:hypothetical protein
MKGYFDGLIRMTGIRFNQGGISSSTGARPIHMEETRYIEPTAGPLKIHSVNNQPTKPQVPLNIQAKERGEKNPVEVDKRLSPISPTPITPIKKQRTPAEAMARESGERQRKTDTGIDETHNMKVQAIRTTESRGKRVELKTGDTEIVSQTRQSPKPEEKPGVEIYETVEAVGSDRNAGGSSAEVAPATKGGEAQTGKKQAEGIVKKGNLVIKKEEAPSLTFKEVRNWVAEPEVSETIKTIESESDKKNKPSASPKAPKEENREFNLTIGSINLTVEEPPPDIPIQPPAQTRSPATDGGESQSDRLSRHYIR